MYVILFYLLLGVLISPILMGIIDYLLVWIEVIKIKPTRIINDWNEELRGKEEINCDIGTDTNVIGFQYTPEEEEYYEDEYYED